MSSKYDEFWRDLRDKIAFAAVDASRGRAGIVEIDGLTQLGARRSWNGKARVQGTRVVRSSMAHADSLARVVTADGIFSQWPLQEFTLSVDARTLTIRMSEAHQTPLVPSRSSPLVVSTGASASSSCFVDAETACARVHILLAALPAFLSPEAVPFSNGLYLFYEHGEASPHAPDGRVVRIGNHPRSPERIVGRLKEHFRDSRDFKNGSVFRRYLGGALMRRDDSSSRCLAPGPGIGHWEYQGGKECEQCERVETQVTNYLTKSMTFRCIQIDDASERNRMEAGLIATIAACQICNPSARWLGNYCYASKVQQSGLWNSQHVGDAGLTSAELARVETLVARQKPKPDLSDTLLIIPCSKSKNRAELGRELESHPLSADIGEYASALLEEGRKLAFTKPGTSLNTDSDLRPALEWYTGQPYSTPGVRSMLLDAIDSGLHCLIIFGGYGIVRPDERIHYYEAHMPTQTSSVWRRRLPVILADYVSRNRIVRSFLSVSRSYANCLPHGLGLKEEWSAIPVFDPTRYPGGARTVVPARVGAAVHDLLASGFQAPSSWNPLTTEHPLGSYGHS